MDIDKSRNDHKAANVKPNSYTLAFEIPDRSNAVTEYTDIPTEWFTPGAVVNHPPSRMQVKMLSRDDV
ncbi:MAG: hypothetical protein V3U10_00900 [Bacteroidota bacterium]